MTDEKKPPEEIEDVDWDQALSEWDQKSFVPEVAKEPQTDKPGALAGSGVSRPLYRPPVQAPRPKGQPPPPPPPRRPPPAPPVAAPAPPPPPAPPAEPPPAALQEEPPIDDEEAGATLIAAIPQELLRSAEEAAPKSSSRGGLGQLFSRDVRDEKRELSVEVSFDESQPRMPAVVAKSDPPGELLTSAKPAIPSRPDPAESAPLRRPSQIDGSERIPEGAMFDPFAEPARDSARKTRPAEEEVDELLAQSQPPPPMAPDPSPPGAADAAELALAGGPALLAPEARKYDPNEETMVGAAADLARVHAAVVARRLGPPDAPEASETVARARAATAPSRLWPDEKPAVAWLSEDTRAAFVARVAWLEQEARALGDKVARARGLLACSEIAATVGEREQAQTLAAEARDLAPSLALAHRQARALMPSPPDPDDYVEALDAEVKMTPAGPARVHSALLTAEALQAAGHADEATKRLDQAARTSSSDVRAAIARAARALGRGELSHAALRLPEAPELAPVAEAIHTLLRLRGVERKETAPTEPSPNELLLKARQALDKGDLVAAAPLVAQLANVPELAGGAWWLASALGATRAARRAEAVAWLRRLVERGDAEARRALAARGIELGDRELVAESSAGGPLTSAERVTLSTLVGSLAADDRRLRRRRRQREWLRWPLRPPR